MLKSLVNSFEVWFIVRGCLRWEIRKLTGFSCQTSTAAELMRNLCRDHLQVRHMCVSRLYACMYVCMFSTCEHRNEGVHSFSWKALSIETSHHHLRWDRISHIFRPSLFCIVVVSCSLPVSVGRADIRCIINVSVSEPGCAQWPLSSSEGLQGSKLMHPGLFPRAGREPGPFIPGEHWKHCFRSAS